MGTEVIQLEDMLAQVRKEYEMLRIEFEQNLAANEQTGPINREMRHLITSLQNHNHQFKVEVQRYKRRYKECLLELTKCRKDIEQLQLEKCESLKTEEAPATGTKEEYDGDGVKEEASTSTIKEEPEFDEFDSFDSKDVKKDGKIDFQWFNGKKGCKVHG